MYHQLSGILEENDIFRNVQSGILVSTQSLLYNIHVHAIVGILEENDTFRNVQSGILVSTQSI